MDGVITRVMLHNLKPIILAAEIERVVNQDLETVKRNIFSKILITRCAPTYPLCGSTQYIVDIKDIGRLSPSAYSSLLVTEKQKILEVFLQKLTQTFPDSVITVDPLKTYILIDWSL